MKTPTQRNGAMNEIFKDDGVSHSQGAKYLSGGPIGRIWTRRLRPLAAVTLLVFAWHASNPWNYVMAMQAPPMARASESERALLRFDRALRDALQAVERLEQEEDLTAGLDSLQAAREEIEAVEPHILADFQAVAEHLQASSVPAEIRQRHDHAVQDYEAGLRLLDEDIEAVKRLHQEYRQASPEDSAAKRNRLKDKVREMRGHLKEKVKDRHAHLDPHRLPHRNSSLTRRSPRLAPEDFAALSASASRTAGTAPVLGLAARASLPGPQDLAATVDAPQTQEIRDLAASLGNHPLRIFEHVRNEIDFTPTHGSIQGAQGCLRTKRCNDLDTASLLVALLRAAGVPARYGFGTVEVPIDKVQNWAGGFTDAQAALNFIASSGTPVVGLTSNNALVAARVEHAWVEAFLDYIPSRGAVPGTVGDSWVALDPSFKQFTYTDGVALAAATDTDDEAVFRQLLESAEVADPDGGVTSFDLAAMQARLQETKDDIDGYLDDHPEAVSLAGLVGGRTIVPQTLPAAPGSLPYKVLVRGAAVAQVPDSLRHRLRFEVFADGRFAFSPDLSFEASLPELAARKLTLSYAPATAADEATLQSFVPAGGDPTTFPSSLPAYLIHVRPELRRDGEVVATGGSATLGQSGEFRMTFIQPGEGPRTVNNDIVAGTYNAIVLNLGRVEDPGSRLAKARDVRNRILAGNLGGLTKDDVVGELVYGAGLLYWSELDLFSRLAAGQQGVVTSRFPSEGIFTYDLSVASLFGVPRTVRSGAMITDVDSDVQAIVARDGDPKKAVDFLSVGGALASRAESAVWDQIVNEEPTNQGITAISYLEAAAQQGIPIFHIDSGNVAQAVPKLQVSSAVKADIQSSVAAGRIVTIPQREFVKDGFRGVGYVVFDPDTGAAGYLISGGLAGGGFQLPPLHPLLTFLLGVLLIGLGIFATGGLAVLGAILGIALIAYDLISTIQNLDPNLSPETREMIVAFLAMLALIGVILAIAGIFLGGVLAFVVFAVYWAFLSLMAAAILISLATLVDSRTPVAGAWRRRWGMAVAVA